MPGGFAVLRDKHRGETIFILGCGPQLAHIPSKTLSDLSQRIAIGVNATPFKLQTTYWCASHPGMCLLTRRLVEDSDMVGVFCEKPNARHKYDALFTWLHRVPCIRERRFKKRRDIMVRGIRANSTIVLEAGQLAIYLGARRIVFIGVSMRTHRHWYHGPRQEAAFEQIKQEVARVQGLSFPGELTEKKNLRHILGHNSVVNTPFRTDVGFGYLRAEIAQFMERARYHDVRLASASADSLLVDCGMKVIDLENRLMDDAKEH